MALKGIRKSGRKTEVINKYEIEFIKSFVETEIKYKITLKQITIIQT